MRDYSAEEVEQLLKKVDTYLGSKVDLILIGGTAAMLAYKISSGHFRY